MHERGGTAGSVVNVSGDVTTEGKGKGSPVWQHQNRHVFRGGDKGANKADVTSPCPLSSSFRSGALFPKSEVFI